MRSRLLWFLLMGIAVSVLVMLARHGRGNAGGMTSDNFASLIMSIGFLALIGGTVLVLFRQNFPKALAAIFFWILFAVLLAAGYTYRFELRDISKRVLTELLPGRAFTRGRIVEIARGRAGDFGISAQINGARIPMALDTGASAVVLTQDAAKAAGLPLEVLNYDVNVDTANGRTRAASVTLDRVGIGGIVERSVPALIAQPGQLRTNLLGMSFLNRLESWEVRGDKLIMRGYP